MYALGKDALSNNGHPGSVLMFAQLMSKIICAKVSSEAGVIANLVSQANTVVKDWTQTTTLLLREPIAAFDPQCLANHERASRGCASITRRETDRVTRLV